MTQDIVGFAMISGGEHNGQFVDKAGNFFRRDGDRMISIETGAAVSYTEQEQEGKVFGAMKKTDPLPGGAGDEPTASLEQMTLEATGEGTMVGQAAPTGEQIDESDDPPTVEETNAVEQIMLNYSGDEIRALLYAARNNGRDVAILEGDSEDVMRSNARQLSKVAE